MLFFKQIIDEKMEDKAFGKFYEKECHICSATVKVIGKIENDQTFLEKIPGASEDLKKSYEDLKNGDHCDPLLVRKLYAILGEAEPESFLNCPRLK